LQSQFSKSNTNFVKFGSNIHKGGVKYQNYDKNGAPSARRGVPKGKVVCEIFGELTNTDFTVECTNRRNEEN
jgi:hypothetical protein